MSAMNQILPPQVQVNAGDPPLQLYDEEIKVDIDQQEKVESADQDPTILKSNYANWGRRPLIRKFWRMYLLGLLCSTAGL